MLVGAVSQDATYFLSWHCKYHVSQSGPEVSKETICSS